MDANHESGATDVDGAASRISSLLGKKQSGLSTEPTKEAAKEQPKPEASQAQPETSQDDTKEAEARYRVKVQGEEKEVTLEDLRKGYMMESDYRIKTSEVSKQKEALTAKQAEIDNQLAEARDLLDMEIEALNTPEMQQLKELEDPEYWRQFEKVQKKADKFSKLKAKRETERGELKKELARKEYDALITAIPDWMDEGVRNKEVSDVFGKLRDIGYSDSELTDLADHRVFVMARKALMFDKIQSQDIKSKEVKTPPKVQQPGNGKTSEERGETKNLRSTLKKSGNIHDAAALFKSFLK